MADKEPGSDKALQTTKRRCSCCKCLFWTVSVVVCVAAVFVGYVYLQLKERTIPEELAQHLGAEGLQMFYAYDRDNDGYLSVEEFEPLYHRLAGSKDNLSLGIGEYNQTIEADDEVVTVVTEFEPLLLSSLSRTNRDGLGMEPNMDDVLYGLTTWTKPNHKWMNFGVQHFQSFLPPQGYVKSFGKSYNILIDDRGLMSMLNMDLSSNRYFPAMIKDDQVIFHRLLAMFHHRPFLFTRFKPRGGVAVVRAFNEEYVEIAFRLHAEFQLHEPPRYPFWFTPGQFTGRLVLTTDLKHMLHFNMYVPADRRLNVDMEWLHGGNNMEVDIGYMPKMSLSITAPSVPAANLSLEEQVPGSPASTENIAWDQQISQEEADTLLEQGLFPFKQVKYYNFTETFEAARREQKLVHAILLWGALDDQSC